MIVCCDEGIKGIGKRWEVGGGCKWAGAMFAEALRQELGSVEDRMKEAVGQKPGVK